MSKSIGNVISPIDIINEYGTDALRYFVLREIHPFDDTDVTPAKLKEMYNSGLANGIGNLVSRVMKMATTNGVVFADISNASVISAEAIEKIEGAYSRYEFNVVCNEIWSLIQSADRFIQEAQPFKKIKENPEEAKKDIAMLLGQLHAIGGLLKPIMPTTSKAIVDCVEKGIMPEQPLFLRK